MDSLQKALEFVDIAINLDKVYSNAYFVKGTILERQGNLKEAQKNYSQASTLNPKFTKAMEESERLRKQLEAVKNNGLIFIAILHFPCLRLPAYLPSELQRYHRPLPL